MTENSNNKRNRHEGHRERMRKKFKENPALLSDHEIVEMLLYNVITLGNTNEQAHDLLERAGSINGILEMDESQILSIKGLSVKSVEYIKLLRELYIRLRKENLDKGNDRKLTKNNINDKLHKIFLGEKEEKMVLITLDNDFNIINTHVVSRGTESASIVPIKKILELAICDKATITLLAHNHPNNVLAASDADIETTKAVYEALKIIEIPLCEHYIVTDNSVVGIIHLCRKNKK
ncbi:MAG: JAB domain-containing protein [Clostridia bacterium]|nr:JAB domain-containing protein [Clostridia bacterium]